MGKRILSGGTTSGGGTTHGSAPNLNKWTASFYHYSAHPTTVRAICSSAGSPSVSVTGTNVPSGSVTSAALAVFDMTGSDPAGFPNGFRCSLDGSVPT